MLCQPLGPWGTTMSLLARWETVLPLPFNWIVNEFSEMVNLSFTTIHLPKFLYHKHCCMNLQHKKFKFSYKINTTANVFTIQLNSLIIQSNNIDNAVLQWLAKPLPLGYTIQFLNDQLHLQCQSIMPLPFECFQFHFFPKNQKFHYNFLIKK